MPLLPSPSTLKGRYLVDKLSTSHPRWLPDLVALSSSWASQSPTSVSFPRVLPDPCLPDLKLRFYSRIKRLLQWKSWTAFENHATTSCNNWNYIFDFFGSICVLALVWTVRDSSEILLGRKRRKSITKHTTRKKTYNMRSLSTQGKITGSTYKKKENWETVAWDEKNMLQENSEKTAVSKGFFCIKQVG